MPYGWYSCSSNSAFDPESENWKEPGRRMGEKELWRLTALSKAGNEWMVARARSRMRNHRIL
uniref:Uncharacterized protein n=1 Tax=Pristionchus pacificus TaxID=54126 RepID=A0A2A6B6Y5_PRIPA|eukprot:PDM61649.1 hypothetical protein PRIPAC_51091 [Pristionchus pacificus]